MKYYIGIGFLAFYPTFIAYYALNRYTVFSNSQAWGLMESCLYFFGVAQAGFLVLLFVPWVRLWRKLLREKYSLLTGSLSGALFGAVISFFLTVIASVSSPADIETSILYYLPLVTYGAVFGFLAFLVERRRQGEGSGS